MNRNDILEAAGRCINGERQQDYGRPENNFSRIARLWEAYSGIPYKPEEVAIMMALLKVARIASGRKADNYIDLAGYAALAGELADLEEQAGQADREGVKVWEPASLGDTENPARPARLELMDALAGRLAETLWQRMGGDDMARDLWDRLGSKPCKPLGGAESPAEPASQEESTGAGFAPCKPLGAVEILESPGAGFTPCKPLGAVEVPEGREAKRPRLYVLGKADKPRLVLDGATLGAVVAGWHPDPATPGGWRWDPATPGGVTLEHIVGKPLEGARAHIVPANGEPRPMTAEDLEHWKGAQAEREAIRKGLEAQIRDTVRAGKDPWDALAKLDGAVVGLLEALGAGQALTDDDFPSNYLEDEGKPRTASRSERVEARTRKALDTLAGEIWRITHPGGVWEV